MDFSDEIKQLSQNIQKQKSLVKNEEATKTAFILPLIKALGYNVFDVGELEPEFVAASPGLKGEKVDYAIKINTEPVILIECKCCHEGLEHPKHSSQLFKYFNATGARFAILTNGILYQFYTDIDKDNIMDDKPFFEFNLEEITKSSVNVLKKFSKAEFNPQGMKNFAINMLYTKEIKRLLSEQLNNPSIDFVKFFASQVYSKNLTTSVIDKFTDLVKQSVEDYFEERITKKIKDVINPPDLDEKEPETKDFIENEKSVITDNSSSNEKIKAFHIVEAILREVIDVNRIQCKDNRIYFSINVDTGNRKTICRLRFNGGKKHIGIMDVDNNEVKHPIATLNDIYKVANILKDRAKFLTEGENFESQIHNISEF
ncbi:restriction endonuclease [Scytonema sp. UIC 10036]|uniref:type I restriction endonuclease n=1 Tax=Scytonema sp. UIC 10036 TaxID=2304196 RepID=UPI0012DA6C94|nr:type I restriction endonuclease [Scytonema sp. UIC 10036]MUH01327.1 restriction endonuclease [Scytonema sp. UIC 10036]